MSKFSSADGKVKLPSLEELLGDGAYITCDYVGQVHSIGIEEIREYKKHPFKVRDDEKMDELVDSIKQNGILTPGIVRELTDGSYEMISGHRRMHALKRLGIEVMPVVICQFNDDEAAIAMVDANIQREEVLPSEKAWAYKIKYEAMKHQGSKVCGLSLDLIAEGSGESGKTVQRYIWLTRLNNMIMELVDEKKIGFLQGVDLSFLSDEQQEWVCDVWEKQHVKISTDKSSLIKKLSKDGVLTQERVKEILQDKKVSSHRLVLKSSKMRKYFPEYYSIKDMEKVIYALLEVWSKGQKEG